MKQLTAAERASALQVLPAWSEVRGDGRGDPSLVGARPLHTACLRGAAQVEGREAISRSFVFSDFNEAWSFMSSCALVAEQVPLLSIQPPAQPWFSVLR